MTDRFVPLTEDLEAALALAGEAVGAAAYPHEDVEGTQALVRREVRAGRLPGGLWLQDGRPAGVALWDHPGPLGVALRFTYLVGSSASAATYRRFLASVLRASGPAAFAAPLSGLSTDDEAKVLGPLGFAPFSRSEMRFPPAVAPAGTSELPGLRVRPVRPTDAFAFQRMHAAAYHDHFDRFLFLQDLDPEQDAATTVRSIFEGRWGEFLPGASALAESSEGAVGGTLVLRSEGRALIADVSVVPTAQGRGVGRAVVGASVRALRGRGEPVIALAVTEENRRAVRLYERLGFVRALGPERRWYSTRLIPIPPGRD